MTQDKPTDTTTSTTDAPEPSPGSVKDRIEDLTEPLLSSLQGPVEHVSAVMSRFMAWKPYRVFIQFSHNDGNLRAAGMSFQSLFAIFAAVWVGFSVAGLWLGSQPLVIDALIDIINRAVPGLIGENGVIPVSAVQDTSTTFGWTGAIAAVGLMWTAIAWLYYTRQAVRAMFGLERDSTNYLLQKFRDFGLALAFGVILIAASVLSVLSTQAVNLIFDWFGISQDSGWSILTGRVIGLLVVLALNVVALGSMFRVLSRVAIPLRYLIVGSLMGSVGLAVLSTLSGILLNGASSNPLLASFAVVIGLLIWFNLVCRVILISASWIAVSMRDNDVSPRKLTPEQYELEQAAEAHRARMRLAEADVARANERYAAARGIGRMVTKRRLAKARQRLGAIAAETAKNKR